MLSSVIIFLLFGLSCLTEGYNGNTKFDNNDVLLKETAEVANNSSEELSGKMGKLFHDFVDLMESATDSVDAGQQPKDELLTPFSEYLDEGRRFKLKYKKAELQFIMKTFMIIKVILGIFLPMGIIASKILSWKAVTLSLMAFMLAKILFVKSLLPSAFKLPTAANNYGPPVYVHASPNDAFWKRQVDLQPQNLYNS